MDWLVDWMTWSLLSHRLIDWSMYSTRPRGDTGFALVLDDRYAIYSSKMNKVFGDLVFEYVFIVILISTFCTWQSVFTLEGNVLKQTQTAKDFLSTIDRVFTDNELITVKKYCSKQRIKPVQGKVPELKRYPSWNSGRPYGQNACPIEIRQQNLPSSTRHGNAPVSTQRIFLILKNARKNIIPYNLKLIRHFVLFRRRPRSTRTFPPFGRTAKSKGIFYCDQPSNVSPANKLDR